MPQLPSLQATIMPTAPTLWTLRCLYSLDTSSPDFSRRLDYLFRRDKEEQYLLNLRGSKLGQLVDFLDGVCTSLSPSISLRNRLHRLSVLFPPTAIFLKNVSVKYKPSVAIARPYHLHMSYLMDSPEWVMVQSPLVPSSMYGKVLIAARKYPSNV